MTSQFLNKKADVPQVPALLDIRFLFLSIAVHPPQDRQRIAMQKGLPIDSPPRLFLYDSQRT
ncbi:hypothetical protein WQ57_14285 [Mesobacillus campisalis]|uniref:Uncharacterized protein n=1 Tax=Mesobacillus campisalis TaxID=1408103 RepID=A0A0M2SWN4_9BACI|nr:hypothetical protein WQ57_14285 [Mesobacillus campisalis]